MPSVLITGAGRGIGRACALALDRRGWDVVAGVRSDAAAEGLRAQAAGRLRTVTLDITDADSIAAARDSVGGRLDALVNNAGIAVGGPIEAVPLDALRRQFEVNVVAQVAVTQAFLPALRATRGRVVLMSSVSGRAATPVLGPYSASKFALEAIGDALRVEVRPWGIRVVLVEPGSIDTDMWRGAEQQFDDTIAELSEEHRVLYAKLLAGARKMIVATARRAAPVELVVEAVEHAVTAESPRTRYLVGRDTKARAAIGRVLPDRASDALLARVMGTR